MAAGGKAMDRKVKEGTRARSPGATGRWGKQGAGIPPWKLQQEPDPPTPRPWPGETGLQPERESCLCVSSRRVGGRV